MKASAGILLYKKEEQDLYFFLVHPGGPFWKNKDLGAWSIPKGELLANEAPLTRARIEFEEETGQAINGTFLPLTSIKQKGGKTVMAWAVSGDIDPAVLHSNSFLLEWPPRSGRKTEIPEVDQWAWFTSEEAKRRINPAQVAFILEIIALVRNKQG
ncbi:NUDIX domain-containing protein [Niabella sp. CC-SYL272]|uniref:NUDIX hydrolase n=1 Tax=Niabella agricola TaxID=2891571 RepID=UPI001F2D8122|nr:NUDIX domain-containing protein [Niabella agricola]MCF3108797.1 NUDIX domain-containing protein [Niabella agricola]